MHKLRAFLARPFAGVYDQVESELIRPALKGIKDAEILVDSAKDLKPLDISSLERDVVNQIEAADFLVAVTTDLNENVLLEIGIALALGKPTVLVNDFGGKLPANIQGRYYCSYNSDNPRGAVEALKDHCRNAIYEVLSADKATHFRLWGYGDRNDCPLKYRLEKAESHVLITTTNLQWFTKPPVMNSLLQRLDQHDKLRVRVLALDPDSLYVAGRASQLRWTVRDFRAQLDKSLRQVSRKLKKHKKRCIITTYDEFPTQIATIIDDSVFFGVVSLVDQARRNVVVEFNIIRHKGAKESFLGHFERLWDRSRRLDGSQPGPLFS